MCPGHKAGIWRHRMSSGPRLYPHTFWLLSANSVFRGVSSWADIYCQPTFVTVQFFCVWSISSVVFVCIVLSTDVLLKQWMTFTMPVQGWSQHTLKCCRHGEVQKRSPEGLWAISGFALSPLRFANFFWSLASSTILAVLSLLSIIPLWVPLTQTMESPCVFFSCSWKSLRYADHYKSSFSARWGALGFGM